MTFPAAPVGSFVADVSVAAEELRHLANVLLRMQVICVEESPAQPGSQRATDRGLSRTGHTRQEDDGHIRLGRTTHQS